MRRFKLELSEVACTKGPGSRLQVGKRATSKWDDAASVHGQLTFVVHRGHAGGSQREKVR